MKRNKILKIVSLVWVVLILLTACTLPFNIVDKVAEVINPTSTEIPGGETSEAPTPVVTPTDLPAISAEDLYGGKFADFLIKSVTLPESFSGGYTLPLQASQVTGIDDFEFTIGQRNALLQNGFVVKPPITDPNRLYQEFYQAYESVRYDETPVFVTTDAVFHVYHLIFDKMLRDLENVSFIPILKELTTAMVNSTAAQYEILKGTDLEQAALRNVAYFTVPAMMLGLQVSVPEEAKSLAQAEVALIEAHGGWEPSPIWETGNQAQDEVLLEDYSQYIPRGHYTRSEDLKTYFKAMMWFGRMTYRLKDPIETQRALLVVQAMRSAKTESGKTALELWQNIYDPTVFIVGKADDLSIYEYGKLSDEIFGVSPDLNSFADPALSKSFFAAAKELPPPQINSMWVWIWQDRDEATPGFQVHGTAFHPGCLCLWSVDVAQGWNAGKTA